jgi:beta-barrel assembly-enhancing protease
MILPRQRSCCHNGGSVALGMLLTVFACMPAVHAAGLGDLLGNIGSLGSLVSAMSGTQSAEEEIIIGEGVAGTVLGAAKVWNNLKAQSYINLIGGYIAQQSERKDLPWAFAIIDTSSINAFAAPGGIVLVTRGLYEMLQSEDELASVLAHEIAHVNRQHHYNVIKQQKVVEFGANLAQKDVSRNSAINRRLANVGADLIARGLDKDAEFEADRDAIVLAARSGYDSSAILATLERLHAMSKSDSAVQLLFTTHPAPADRIQKLSEISNADIEVAAVTSPAADRIRRDGR